MGGSEGLAPKSPKNNNRYGGGAGNDGLVLLLASVAIGGAARRLLFRLTIDVILFCFCDEYEDGDNIDPPPP